MGVYEATENMLDWLASEEKKQMEWILTQAEKYRPQKYMSEIPRRIDYLKGDMESDGLALLKKEFGHSWEDLEYKMMEYPIAKFITEKRAQTFRGKNSKFVLKDGKGEPVSPKSIYSRSAAAMLDGAQLTSALIEMDRREDITNGCAIKVWWDRTNLELSPFCGDKVHIAVNPARYWDPWSAYGIAFETEGWEGKTSKPKYEVWATRDRHTADAKDQDGGAIFHPTLHYISADERKISVNEGDTNPYRNRWTREPLYPFWWFRSTPGDIYQKGGDDLVRFNRILNMLLTYLFHNVIWQIASIPTFEFQGNEIGSDDLKKLRNIVLSSPRKTLELPPGVSLKFSHPDVNLEPFTNFAEMLIQYEALTNALSPKSISVQGGLPQSGIALQIEFDNLVKYQEDRVKIFKPQVETLINEVMVSIWNVRAPKVPREKWTAIPEDHKIDWDPGVLDTGPTDYGEIIDRYSRGIELGVYSVDDLAMTLHNVDKETARAMVDENLSRNAIVLQSQTRYPDDPEKPDLGDVPVEGDDDKVDPVPEPDTDDKSGEGVEQASGDKLVSNIYQIIKAVDEGIISRAEARMLIFPGEDQATAERMVEEAIRMNRELSPDDEGDNDKPGGKDDGGSDEKKTDEEKTVPPGPGE